MAKKSQRPKLNWTDTEELAFLLIDEHPSVNPSKVSPPVLKSMVQALEGFGDKKKPEMKLLEDLRDRWLAERSEMEDELGPYEDFAGEDSDDLDEDAYREDRMVESTEGEAEDRDEVSLDEAFGDEDDDEEDPF